jgi:hypothetical protein
VNKGSYGRPPPYVARPPVPAAGAPARALPNASAAAAASPDALADCKSTDPPAATVAAAAAVAAAATATATTTPTAAPPAGAQAFEARILSLTDLPPAVASAIEAHVAGLRAAIREAVAARAEMVAATAGILTLTEQRRATRLPVSISRATSLLARRVVEWHGIRRPICPMPMHPLFPREKVGRVPVPAVWTDSTREPHSTREAISALHGALHPIVRALVVPCGGVDRSPVTGAIPIAARRIARLLSTSLQSQPVRPSARPLWSGALRRPIPISERGDDFDGLYDRVSGGPDAVAVIGSVRRVIFTVQLNKRPSDEFSTDSGSGGVTRRMLSRALLQLLCSSSTADEPPIALATNLVKRSARSLTR